jgi:hypothetical protein
LIKKVLFCNFIGFYTYFTLKIGHSQFFLEIWPILADFIFRTWQPCGKRLWIVVDPRASAHLRDIDVLAISATNSFLKS